MNAPWWLPFGQVPEVRPADLAREMDDEHPPLLLDVRSSVEFAAGHLAGAVNVPVTSLQASLAALELDPGRRVVAICLSAHRSPPAVRLLRRSGLDARQLAGGMLAWWTARLPSSRD
jgi:rhodanese-related sulfurtransferase